MSFHFIHPCTMIVSGPTGCGKTHFISEVIKQQRFMPMPSGKLLWIYGQYQAAEYDQHKEIGFDFIKDGLDDTDICECFDPTKTNLLIIDDQMEKVLENKMVSKLFTQGSHHRNLSVILLIQNLFAQGRKMRDIGLNTQYNVVFRNPRDRAQIRILGQQMYPTSPNFILECFEDATRDPYGYLIINNHSSIEEDEYRVCTDIFNSQSPVYYVPRSVAYEKYQPLL